MEQEISTINIGSLGVINLTLPKIVFKGEKIGPNIVFIVGQHGKEITPFFALRKLAELLKQQPLISGSLTIIPGANPLGLVFGSRCEPLDGDDLNRAAPGNSEKNLSKRIAAAIFGVCQKADLVIDFHAFSRQCRFTGVLIKTDNQIEEKCKTALRVIQPDCLWQIDLERQEDKRFYGALDVALNNQGIPAITLEMEQHLLISDEEINRVAKALMQLLAYYKMIESEELLTTPLPIPIFVGTYLYFDIGGIFTPEQKIFVQIQEGEKLGTVFDLCTFKEIPVVAPVPGVILTLLPRNFVRVGSKLGSIGKQIGVL